MKKFIDVVLTETPTDKYSGYSIAETNKITQVDVDGFIASTLVKTIGNKTTFVQVTLLNGFTLEETSSCVDPANYDEALGAEYCLEKIKDKIWYLLGFLLQSALYGFEKGGK